MKLLFKRLLRSWGYDIVRVPYPNSLERHLAYILETKCINVVLDVGGHHGEFAASLRNAGYRGVIHSFEPVSASFTILQARASRDKKWIAHKLALGTSSGERRIHVTSGSSMSSFLNPNAFARAQFMSDSQILHDETVKVSRLDLEFAAIASCVEEPRCYLKLDTQGWDLEVLNGASGCLDKIYAMQSELSIRPIYDGMPTYVDTLQTLSTLGFGVSGMFPVKLDTCGAMIEVDCVLVKLGLAESKLS